MNQRIRLKVSHRRPKQRLTAREHDDAFRKIGCTDGLKPNRDRERVPPPKKKRRKS